MVFEKFLDIVWGREDLRSSIYLFIIIIVIHCLLRFLVLEMVINIALFVNFHLADRTAYHCWNWLRCNFSFIFGVYSLVHSHVDFLTFYRLDKIPLFDPTIYSPYLVVFLLLEVANNLLDIFFLWMNKEKYKFIRHYSWRMIGYFTVSLLLFLEARFPHHIVFVCCSLVVSKFGNLLPDLFYFLKSLKLKKVANIFYYLNFLVYLVVNCILLPVVGFASYFFYVLPELTKKKLPVLFFYPPFSSPYLVFSILNLFVVYNIFVIIRSWVVFANYIFHYDRLTSLPLSNGEKYHKRKAVEQQEEKEKKKENKKVKKNRKGEGEKKKQQENEKEERKGEEEGGGGKEEEEGEEEEDEEEEQEDEEEEEEEKEEEEEEQEEEEEEEEEEKKKKDDKKGKENGSGDDGGGIKESGKTKKSKKN